MKRLLDWLEARTGCRTHVRNFLFESIPGGARWRYGWGTALVYAFAVQVVTGVFLWMSYSPSGQTAWESVFYIQNDMTGGWLLRGLHHFTAQAFMVLVALHLFQMILYGAYRAPRELTFWLLLLLLPLGIGISATGWLLPYDLKGFWASRVPINLTGTLPVIGPLIQKIAVGGSSFGHHTLTRFFAFHAGLFPVLIGLTLGLHFRLLHRQGLADAGAPGPVGQRYWPDQAIRDATLCLGVLGVVVLFIYLPRLADPHAAPGVELAAPADPSEQYSAARPEWFMLFLFQFLKYFPGQTEIIGAVIIPTLVIAIFAAMPFTARWRNGHHFNVLFTCALAAGMITLISLALAEDARNLEYQAATESARLDGERVKELAHSPAGIPNTGALTLIHNDPYLQGPRLFAKHCASCHRHNGEGGASRDPQSAPDLKGFASREWLEGLLDPARVDSTNYFGGTKHADGKMVKFVKKDVAKYSDEEKHQLAQVIAALSAEAQLRSQLTLEQHDPGMIKEGRKLMIDLRCTECHTFRNKDPEATAPDLTGYGSREWIAGIIRNPAHPRYYGKRNDRMPAFGTSASQILTAQEINLLADWLRGQWYEPAK